MTPGTSAAVIRAGLSTASYFSALSRMVSDSAKTLRQKDAELATIHSNAVSHRQLGIL